MSTDLITGHEQIDALSRVGGMQRVGGQYATAIAVQKPRDPERVHEALMKEASVAGTSFFYAWGAGEDRVMGASVDMAMSAVRLWGNCVVELQPVQDMPDSWIFTAAFVDLETGFTLTRQFRQSKSWTVYGKFDAARKEDIRFQIGQSKAVRNVILNALPSWLFDHALDAARGSVRDKVEAAIKQHGREHVVGRTLQWLAELGVTEKQILDKFKRKNIANLTTEDIVMMKADVDAIKAGQDSAADLYPPPSTTDQLASKIRSQDMGEDVFGKPATETEPDEPKTAAKTKAPADTATDEKPKRKKTTRKKKTTKADDSKAEAAPPEGLSQAFVDLFDLLAQCENESHLIDVGNRVTAARNSGRITLAQFEELKAEIKRREREIG